MPGVRDPRLLAVDDDVRAVAARGRLHRGQIGTGAGLRNRKRGDRRARGDAGQVLPLRAPPIRTARSVRNQVPASQTRTRRGRTCSRAFRGSGRSIGRRRHSSAPPYARGTAYFSQPAAPSCDTYARHAADGSGSCVSRSSRSRQADTAPASARCVSSKNGQSRYVRSGISPLRTSARAFRETRDTRGQSPWSPCRAPAHRPRR